MDGTGFDGMLFPLESEDGQHGGKKKRMFLAGGPFGPLYPMGMIPADGFGYEEEEDPNP